jgi:branched-chain amino acid transport system ATP-binding protein
LGRPAKRELDRETAVSENALLEIRSLDMRFGGFVALDGVSIGVNSGSSTAIVGPNGAGKTTLLNCLCGMYRPTKGSILFRGERIDGRRPHQIVAKGIARTFQSVEQFRSMTALELTLMGGLHQRFRSGMGEIALHLPRAQREERDLGSDAIEMLNELGISEYARSRLETLPYAVRKLADLARALAGKPELLLLDEPGAGMGAIEKEALLGILSRLRGSCFQTLVVIDHDIQFLQNLCQDAIVLDFGRKIADGKTVEVLRNRQVVEAYLGVAAEPSTDEPSPGA